MAAKERHPGGKKVAIHWPCERCGRWVHTTIDRTVYERHLSNRLPFLCSSCELTVNWNGGLFGTWLEEQEQCGT